jgi:hypothetical protein
MVFLFVAGFGFFLIRFWSHFIQPAAETARYFDNRHKRNLGYIPFLLDKKHVLI